MIALGVLGGICIGALLWMLSSVALRELRRYTQTRNRALTLSDTGTAKAKILQFYASPQVIGRGMSVQLCYGVAAAETVRMEPQVAVAIGPAVNRCISVTPERTTQYELIAVGKDGREVTSSVEVSVQ